MLSWEKWRRSEVLRDHPQRGIAVAWVNVSEYKRFSPEKFQKMNLFETERMFCDVYCFEAGQEQTPHKHQGADKIYYVLEGKGLVQIGAERRELLPGMAAHASSGEEHAVENPGPDRLVMLVFMAPHP
jgi:quercetin dioxygenase-like cupin family protein